MQARLGAREEAMPILNQIRWVFFDWGGTLSAVEGESDAWGRCMDAILDAAGKQGLPAGEAHRQSLLETFLRARDRAKSDPEHCELELPALLSQWASEENLGEPKADVLERMNRACWEAWIGCLRVIAGVPETLAALRSRGYGVGLVSNVVAPPSWCRVQLESLGLWDLLDTVTFSSGVGVRKPHPRIFEVALAAVRGNPRTEPHQVLFVGDSPVNDVVGAAQQGMRTALVRDLAGIWPAADYDLAKPDLTVDSVADLLPHLPGPA